MFKWYRNSKVCYAYIEDCVWSAKPTSESIATFGESRWFTRGFTLQELIAPTQLRFYDKDWEVIGEKIDLTHELEQITKIDANVLRGGPLDSVSVGRRMSWAANRKTTREEDIAYCLMGIFGVNMPLLYGEGSKAFIRLQEEIIKDSEDHSLFTWMATRDSASASPCRGLFADSPNEFDKWDTNTPFITKIIRAGYVPMSVTNRGVAMIPP